MAEQTLLPQPRTLLQIGMIVASFAAVYTHTVSRLVEDWSIDPNFSHGFLIPPIAAYMLWQKREQLAKAPRDASLWGLIVLSGFGIAVYILVMYLFRRFLHYDLFSLVRQTWRRAVDVESVESATEDSDG